LCITEKQPHKEQLPAWIAELLVLIARVPLEYKGRVELTVNLLILSTIAIGIAVVFSNDSEGGPSMIVDTRPVSQAGVSPDFWITMADQSHQPTIEINASEVIRSLFSKVANAHTLPFSQNGFTVFEGTRNSGESGVFLVNVITQHITLLPVSDFREASFSPQEGVFAVTHVVPESQTSTQSVETVIYRYDRGSVIEVSRLPGYISYMAWSSNGQFVEHYPQGVDANRQIGLLEISTGKMFLVPIGRTVQVPYQFNAESEGYYAYDREVYFFPYSYDLGQPTGEPKLIVEHTDTFLISEDGLYIIYSDRGTDEIRARSLVDGTETMISPNGTLLYLDDSFAIIEVTDLLNNQRENISVQFR